jgi:hypothetical protein
MIDANLEPSVASSPEVADRSMRRLEYLLALICIIATLALSAAR